MNQSGNATDHASTNEWKPRLVCTRAYEVGPLTVRGQPVTLELRSEAGGAFRCAVPRIPRPVITRRNGSAILRSCRFRAFHASKRSLRICWRG